MGHDGIDTRHMTRGVFHIGEETVQRRFGVRDRLAETGQRSIRPFMPDQHREFFAHLCYVLIAASDRSGHLWASMLSGNEGFISSPDSRRLAVAAGPEVGDPLADALLAGVPLGVLGIDLATRRRNRVNGHVQLPREGGGFHVAVAQSFGNCPQYIWPGHLG